MVKLWWSISVKGNIKAQINGEVLTWVIEQGPVVAFLGGWNQIPDEALDLVITFVVS